MVSSWPSGWCLRRVEATKFYCFVDGTQVHLSWKGVTLPKHHLSLLFLFCDSKYYFSFYYWLPISRRAELEVGNKIWKLGCNDKRFKLLASSVSKLWNKIYWNKMCHIFKLAPLDTNWIAFKSRNTSNERLNWIFCGQHAAFFNKSFLIIWSLARGV